MVQFVGAIHFTLGKLFGTRLCDAVCSPAVTALTTCCALFFDMVLCATIPAITLIAPRIPAISCPHGAGATAATVAATAPVTALVCDNACVVGLSGVCIEAHADASANTAIAKAKVQMPGIRAFISTPIGLSQREKAAELTR
jgi:hypothetical protein